MIVIANNTNNIRSSTNSNNINNSNINISNSNTSNNKIVIDLEGTVAVENKEVNLISSNNSNLVTTREVIAVAGNK